MGNSSLNCFKVKKEKKSNSLECAPKNGIHDDNSKENIIEEPKSFKSGDIMSTNSKQNRSKENNKINKKNKGKSNEIEVNGDKSIDNNKKNNNLIDEQKEKDLKLKEREINDKLIKEKEPILVGLNNIGATCYMNATLQSLSNTDKLTEYFLTKYKYEPNNKKKIMSNEYYTVINNLWSIDNNKKSYSPYEFKEKLSQENPLFAGIAANDSKDLINFLLERMHTELNIIKNDTNFNED